MRQADESMRATTASDVYSFGLLCVEVNPEALDVI